MVRLFIAAVVCVTLLGACGGGSGADGADVDDEMIAFAARWQCERERHAFDALEEVAERFDASREAAGVSEEAFAEFEAALAADAALRARLLEEYRTTCA